MTFESIHANIFTDHPQRIGSRPYGQPGQLPIGGYNFPPLLKLTFIGWLILTKAIFASTCKMVNKSSKSEYLLYRLWKFIPNIASGGILI